MHRYRRTSPTYRITVTPCCRQSLQKLEAENLGTRTQVAPGRKKRRGFQVTLPVRSCCNQQTADENKSGAKCLAQWLKMPLGGQSFHPCSLLVHTGGQKRLKHLGPSLLLERPGLSFRLLTSTLITLAVVVQHLEDLPLSLSPHFSVSLSFKWSSPLSPWPFPNQNITVRTVLKSCLHTMQKVQWLKQSDHC